MSDRNIVKVSADAAYQTARKNRLRNYPSPERGGDRLYPIATPSGRPSFSIGPSDTIFTMGSCFARNVELALQRQGMTVLSADFDLGPIEANTTEVSNFFNKYSIHSIAYEMRWALDRASFPGEALLYPAGPGGGVFDLQLGSALLKSPVDAVLAFRHRYLDTIARVAEADLVIITLGYVETWYDRELDLYLNVAPPPGLVKRFPGRFEFRVLSYQDILTGLMETYDLLKRHRTKPMKMLVTVSPVPLKTTFRDMDVLVANAYSKSVQRAAIDEFLTLTEDVDYFPSYEFVTLSHPDVTWRRSDYRHLSHDFVDHIMSNVLSSYLSTPAGQAPAARAETVETLLGDVRFQLRAKSYETALRLLDAAPDIVEGSDALLLARETCLRELGRDAEAFDVLTRVIELAPERPRPLERMIELCAALQRPQDAVSLTELHRTRFPARRSFRGDPE